MAAAVRALVALDYGVDAHTVESVLPVASNVQVVGMVEGLERGWTVLEETSPDMLLIACQGYSERALYLIEDAAKNRPDRPIVVLFFGSPDGFMERIFEAGADDLLTLPASADEVRFALEKVVARKRGSGGAAALNPMICVLGPKGGTGKTLTVCNLAAALAALGKQPAVVDLDLQFGDVGIALGLSPERTIHDLAVTGGSIDSDKVDGFLMKHPSGVRALLAPSRPDQAAAVSVELLREVYAALRSRYDFVIVDTPPGFNPEVIATIDSASHLCVVGTLDALSLKDTKLGLETLELMGCDLDRVVLVLNRADSKIGISHADASTILGRNPDVLVPSDREIPRAVTEGRPIVGNGSAAARSFDTLARRFLDEQPIVASPNGSSSPNGSRSPNRNGSSKRRGPLSALLRRS
jgi:MinD-like ATPase involved in chromosome partitioning or flagellar assembly/CheY-like chemotaxis protein